MEMPAPNNFVVRELSADDAPAIRDLFQQVFKKEMSAALWNWKYRRPLSRMYGVFRDGALVAHYGGLGAVVSFNGGFVNAVQIVDVMVKPSERHGARNRSPFYLAASQFIDRFVGIDALYLLGYGFPNERAMAIAAHMNFYTAVGRMWELTWELAEEPRLPWWLRATRIDANNFARYRGVLDQLWRQQLHDLEDRIVVRKDAAFVQWRYLEHPVEQYELVLLTQRFTGTALGFCVVKAEAERAQLMEVIAPLRHLPRLALAAQVTAWNLQRRTLYTWCSTPDTQAFGAVTSAQATKIITPGNARTSGPRPDELQDRWWLLPGDTDFL